HANFTTWFKNTELIGRTEDTITIAVPNIFAKRQFEVKFNDQIKTILEKNGVVPRSIIYTVKSSSKRTVSREVSAPAKPSVDDLLPSAAPKTTSRSSTTSGNSLNPRYT